MRKISIILSVCYAFVVNAQSPIADNYLKSPNMTEISQYGEVPVSLYTGTAQVNVPLFTLETGNHAIDISLAYHGGGVRPDYHPGWVGLGWTLFAGGSITRVVGGLPDECDDYMAPTNVLYGTNFGPERGLFYGNYGHFSNTSEHKTAYKNLNFPTSISTGYPFVYPAWDIEPDKFMFNFMGYSGTFFYTCDKGWIVECDKPIKVVFDINDKKNYSQPFKTVYDVSGSGATVKNSRSVSINNFLIIDEFGNKYYFGGSDKQAAIEYSVGYFNQHNSEMTATAWHLTKIEYVDGRTVELSYEKKDYVVEMGISDTYCKFSYQIFDTAFGQYRTKHGEMYNGIFLSSSMNQDYLTRSRDFASGSLITPSYLKQIKIGEYQVDFITQESKELEYPMDAICEMHFNPRQDNDWGRLVYLQQIDPNEGRLGNSISTSVNKRLKWHKLTEIRISNNQQQILRSFKLKYNDERPENQYKVRLCLEQVEEVGVGKYRFEYDRPESLPDYCSYNIDHWGFFKETNIATRNVSAIGQHSVNRRYKISDPTYLSQRGPDGTKGTIGALMKISYPTGGYTRFEYEPHDYLYSVRTSKSGLDKEYQPLTAGGIRIKNIYNSTEADDKGEFLYKQYVYRDIINDAPTASSGILLHPVRYSFKNNLDNTNYYREMHNAQGIRPLGLSSDGCHVAYSSVSEISNDGSITVHHFTDYHEFPDLLLEDTLDLKRFQYIIPACSMAGFRGQLRLKRMYSNKKQLLESVGYTYSTDFSTEILATKLVSTPTDIGVLYDIYPVKIHTRINLPILIQDTTYFDNGAIQTMSTSITYTHPEKMTSEIAQTYNDNYTMSTNFLYPFNKASNNSIWESMTEANMFAYPINMHQTVRLQGNSYFKENVDYTYDDSLRGLPIKIEQKTVENSSPSSISYAYGQDGTLLSKTDNESGDTTVYIWGYNNQHIVAMIQHTSVSQVKQYIGDLNTFAQTATPNFSMLKSLRSILTKADVYTYKYIPGVGMSECTMPEGQIIHYYYDSAGRLSLTTDSNGSILEVYDYGIISNK